MSAATTGARASLDKFRALLETVGDVLDEQLTLVDLAAGGEVGAAFVRRADGRESVLSMVPDAEGLRRAMAALALAQAQGLPVPRYEDVVETAHGVAVLQQRLPGHPPDRIDDLLVDQMLNVSDRLRGLLASEPSFPASDLYLTTSGPGFCRHESLARHSPRSQALLSWIRTVGAEDGSINTGTDLVHLDFHPGNVLVDDAGRITGLIDWDAAGRGDARLAYTTLLFDLDHGRRHLPRYEPLSDRALDRVRDRVRAVEAPRRRMFWAHMSLRQVDWSIRFHPPEIVDHYLDYALDGIES